jgi:hypothetical protein
MADFPFQTTQTAVQLVLNGVMDRYPDVRVILSHAGGFLPYASLRFAELARVFNPDAPSPDVILASLRRFYFDTALASGPALPTLIAFTGSSRILFGTDSPYEHGVSAAFTAALDADSSLTADDRARPEPPPGPVTAKPSPLGEIASARNPAQHRHTVSGVTSPARYPAVPVSLPQRTQEPALGRRTPHARAQSAAQKCRMHGRTIGPGSLPAGTTKRVCDSCRPRPQLPRRVVPGTYTFADDGHDLSRCASDAREREFSSGLIIRRSWSPGS